MSAPELPVNPYDSSGDNSHTSPIQKPAPPRATFYDQAAKFSLYSPFVMFFMNFINLVPNPMSESAAQISFILSWIFILTTIAAFVLGIVGLIGGIARRATGTIIRASLGVVLNGGLLYLVVSSIAFLLTRAPK